jgi:hypothetical protein
MESHLLAGIIGAALETAILLLKPVALATLSFTLEDEKTGGGLGGALGLASFVLGVRCW